MVELHVYCYIFIALASAISADELDCKKGINMGNFCIYKSETADNMTLLSEKQRCFKSRPLLDGIPYMCSSMNVTGDHEITVSCYVERHSGRKLKIALLSSGKKWTDMQKRVLTKKINITDTWTNVSCFFEFTETITFSFPAFAIQQKKPFTTESNTEAVNFNDSTTGINTLNYLTPTTAFASDTSIFTTATEPPANRKKEKKDKTFMFIVGVGCAGLAVVIATTVCCCICMHRRRRSGNTRTRMTRKPIYAVPIPKDQRIPSPGHQYDAVIPRAQRQRFICQTSDTSQTLYAQPLDVVHLASAMTPQGESEYESVDGSVRYEPVLAFGGESVVIPDNQSYYKIK